MHGLVPDPEGEGAAVLRRIPIGMAVPVDIKDPRRRSNAYHRFFFALLTKVWANQQHFATVDQLRHALLVRLGYCDVIRIKGRDFVVPRSMSFAKMPKEEAEKFMTDAVRFITDEVIPGMDATELRDEIENMVRGEAA